jgi:hypothetical protein
MAVPRNLRQLRQTRAVVQVPGHCAPKLQPGLPGAPQGVKASFSTGRVPKVPLHHARRHHLFERQCSRSAGATCIGPSLVRRRGCPAHGGLTGEADDAHAVKGRWSRLGLHNNTLLIEAPFGDVQRGCFGLLHSTKTALLWLHLAKCYVLHEL